MGVARVLSQRFAWPFFALYLGIAQLPVPLLAHIFYLLDHH